MLSDASWRKVGGVFILDMLLLEVVGVSGAQRRDFLRGSFYANDRCDVGPITTKSR